MVTTLTTRIPRTWVIPSPEVAERDAAAERTTLRLLTFLLFSEIFLQRVGLPLAASGIPLILPLLLGVMGLLLVRGDLQTNLGRTRAYLIAMAFCSGAALVAFTRGETNASLTSLLLLVVTYLPFCFGLSPAHRATLFPKLLDRFVLMTTILAGVALAQFALQLVGWKYSDIVGNLVPADLQMHNFNTSYPVRYGSSLYKSNAFVCLEPSFTSQFLAFGLVVSVLRNARKWRLPVYVLAILATVSGTGVLLLAIALVLLAVHKGARFALTAFAGVALVITALSFTPAANIFAERATEASSSASSGSLRFVQPYTRTYDIMSADPILALSGNGPGWSDRNAASFFAQTNLPLNYALLPKLLLEYGLLAGAVFLVFLVAAFVRGSPSFVLSGSNLVFYVVLSSSLLNPVVVYLGLLLLGWFTEDMHALARPVPAPQTATMPPPRRRSLTPAGP
jgi:hypothetical protein